MIAIELLPCPFCGGEAASVPDPNHSTGWDVGCFSGTCEIEPHVWAVHHTTAIDQWNRRTDLSQAAVAAALEAAASDEVIARIWANYGSLSQAKSIIQDLITPAQHDALAAHVAAAVAKARAEIYAQIEAMPRREELLGGQRTEYIQLHEALAWIGAKP